jgi:hypothetical protein
VGCWKFKKIDLPPTMLDRRFKSRHLLTQRRACCPGLPRGPEQAPAPWSPPSAACAPRIIELSGGCWKFEKIDLPPTMLDRRFKSRHLLTQRRACCPGLPRGPEQAPAPWSPPSAACAPRIIEFSGGCWKFEKIDLPPTMLDRRFKSRHLLTQRRACCPGLPRGPEQAPAPWSPRSAACAPRIIEFSGGCWKFEKIDLPPTMLDRRFKSRHLLTQRRACCPGLPRGPEQAPAPWSPPSAACAPRIIEFSGGCWKFEKIDLPPTMLDRRFKSRHLLTQRRACCPGLPRGPEQAPAPWSPPSAACAPRIIEFSGGCWKFEKIDLPPTMLDRRFKSRHLLTQRRACCPGLPRGPEQAPAPWSPPSAACAPRIIEFSGGCQKIETIDLPPTMLDRRFKSRHLLTQRRACCPGLPRGPEQAPAPWSPRSAACAPRIIEFSGGCQKIEKIDLPPTMLDRRFKSRHLLTQRRACCPGLPRGPEQAPAPWSPPSAACAPRIIELSRGVLEIRENRPPPDDAGPALQEPASAYPEARMLPRAAPRPRAGACTLESSLRCLRTSDHRVLRGLSKNRENRPPPRRCWTGASRAGICLPRDAHAAPGCPEAPSRRLHPGVLPPLPAHLGSSSSPGGVGNSRKSTCPRRCWTGASRAGICLPRGAHAAPGCPEAPSRRLHPGVLPPLPAHLRSSSSPGVVKNSRKSTSPRRCWTGASRAGICLPRGAHAAPGCPEAPSRRLHPGVLPPLPAHLGSSSSPGFVKKSRKSTSPRRCWTGASRAGICLPRDAHAAPGCPEAPSRRLHPGVLPPLPAHLGSSSSPGGVGNSRKSTSPRRCWTGASRAGICLPRGAHAAPGCPEAPSRRLHPGVLPPLPAHLGSSSSPGVVGNSRKSTSPRRC